MNVRGTQNTFAFLVTDLGSLICTFMMTKKLPRSVTFERLPTNMHTLFSVSNNFGKTTHRSTTKPLLF